MQIDLVLGGESIRLTENQGRETFLWPFWPMDLFISNPPSRPDIEVDVQVVHDLPPIPHGPILFDSDHGLWKLYQADNGYYLETLNTKDHQPYTRSLVSLDYGRVQMWYRETLNPHGSSPKGWIPAEVLNPVVEICLVTRLARRGGVLFHASSVKVNDSAYVFSGPSGAGKSTIADFFMSKTGGIPLSDERTILGFDGDQLKAYGSPWYGSSHYATNDSAPLERFFLIAHGSGRHQFRPLSVSEWSRRFLRECAFPHWDRQGMERLMVFSDELMRHSGCVELSFLKSADVVDFVQSARKMTVSL